MSNEMSLTRENLFYTWLPCCWYSAGPLLHLYHNCLATLGNKTPILQKSFLSWRSPQLCQTLNVFVLNFEQFCLWPAGDLPQSVALFVHMPFFMTINQTLSFSSTKLRKRGCRIKHAIIRRCLNTPSTLIFYYFMSLNPWPRLGKQRFRPRLSFLKYHIFPLWRIPWRNNFGPTRLVSLSNRLSITFARQPEARSW